MRRAGWLAVFLGACLSGSGASRGGDPFGLRPGEKVAFFGDSITQGGLYVVYFDAYLRTRFPEARFDVVNRGISSETISGTSEEDHTPRRPHADVRFARDITPLAPQVVVACFGMNDGNYHPFDQERFEKYQAGVRRLRLRVEKEAGARLVLLTPPPFDPYQRRASDPQAKAYGYKFAAINYDDTLAAYSRWLLSLREEGIPVGDAHGASNAHLRERRKAKVSFHLAGDAVHPGPTGHLLMTQALLEALHAPGELAEARVDAAAGTVAAGAIQGWEAQGEGWVFQWTTPLPWPTDPDWDSDSLALERWQGRWNRQTLVVSGLPAGRYALTIQDAPAGNFTNAQWAAGVDLSGQANLPQRKLATEVLAQVKQRERLLYNAWRKSLTLADEAARKSLLDDAQRQAETLNEALRKACAPRAWKCTLVREPETQK